MRRPNGVLSRPSIAIAAIAALVMVFVGCEQPTPAGSSDQPAVATAQAAPASAATGGVVERGKYLVAAGACIECHTPFRMGANGPEPDLSRLLSGHPESEVVDPPPPPTPHSGPTWMWSQSNTMFQGAFGTSYAINLTPDEATGIGAWTEDIFVQSIKTGRHWGASRPILPPMPWQSYSRLTEDDLKAIYAYLRTLPPIENRVPEAQVAPPPAPSSAL